jgi:NAD(P)-dependent dehydrogenase (short-subunit alcohol dehydrogenase family)
MSTVQKTVLITGSSSGIGLETTLYFHERKWNIIAWSLRRVLPERMFFWIFEKAVLYSR